MPIVVVENLSKIYPVAVKESGLKATITHFFRRSYQEVKAVQDVSLPH
jgi:ABC-2 type transport system ATP-binding protein